ncbi:hypothetical protein Tco_0567312 [Tanacetum coccineum]
MFDRSRSSLGLHGVGRLFTSVQASVLHQMMSDITQRSASHHKRQEMDCPDFEASHVHGFVHSYIQASYP